MAKYYEIILSALNLTETIINNLWFLCQALKNIVHFP